MEAAWIQPRYDLETITLLLGCEHESKILAFNVLQFEARNIMRESEERRSRFSRDTLFRLKGFRNTSRFCVNKHRNYAMFAATSQRSWALYTKLQSSNQKISSLWNAHWLFTKTYSWTRVCHLLLQTNWLISHKTALWLCLVIIIEGTDMAGVTHFKQVHLSNKKVN